MHWIQHVGGFWNYVSKISNSMEMVNFQSGGGGTRISSFFLSSEMMSAVSVRRFSQDDFGMKNSFAMCTQCHSICMGMK